MTEVWRTIPSHPNYEASSLGRVRRAVDGVNTWAGRILTNCELGGYHVVGVSSGGKAKHVKVHRLVCEAFHGPAPFEGAQVAHGDGVRSNNVPGNLRWATCQENQDDRRIHGTDAKGERNGRSILTADAVRVIRAAPKRRGICIDLAEQFGVSVGAINIIRQRNSPVWKDVA